MSSLRMIDGIQIDYSEISRPVIQYELYNPAEDEVEFMYNGECYRIPPYNVAWKGKHPQTGDIRTYPEPGILPLWGRGRISALDILRHAVGDDGLSGAVGGRGIRPLFGDPKRDAAVRKEARVAYVECRFSICQAITRAHETSVRLAGENQTERPIPSKRVQEAYLFLREHMQEQSRQFVCPVCNWGFGFEKEMHIHVVSIHPDTKEAQTSKDKLGMTGEHYNSGPPSMVPAGRKGKSVEELELDGASIGPTATAAVSIAADGSGVQEPRDLGELNPMKAGYKE